MKAKEFIPSSKPRNFVAKNQQTAGAGAHRDKKKEQKQGYEKHKGKGVAEGIPQPGSSSGAPKQFGPDAKIETRQMTVKQIISSIPGVPYYNNVVDDWDAKDYSWGVTKKVIEYATYLKDHPETVTQLPPAIVLNGKFEDGAHRVSAIWLLQQRMDPKNPLWANAKLNVQFVKQGVAEGFFGIDDSIKGKIQNIVSQLSDIPGMWDHQGQTFTDSGMDKLKTALKNNPKYIKYAVNLRADDYEAD